MDFNPEMNDVQFVEWCRERDLPVGYILVKYGGLQILKQLADEAYQDGQDEANWVCSGRP
jgi:hypothetical protein